MGGSIGLAGCGFLSSSCLSNSGCLGLSGLNLTDCGGGGGGLVNSGFKNQEGAEWTKHRTEIQNGACFSYPDYSSESTARSAMSYPRDSLSNVNKDEPFNVFQESIR